jgi:hypothetical protein
MNIKCNNVPRPLLNWGDLTAKEQKEFDYLDTENAQLEANFVRYRGACYDVGEFQTIPKHNDYGWEWFNGYYADTYFSGVLLRYHEEFEYVVMATYCN